MEKELPKGWVETTIGNLATIVGGGTPNSSVEHYFEGDIGWVTPADLSKYNDKYISSGRRSITEEALNSCSARLMPEGTVLFSSRAPIGYVVIASGPISTNQGFKSLIPNQAYLPELAYYYLKNIKPLAESYASGTTFLELSGKKMAELPFPLPPKAEQERIVAKLDTLFGELEKVKTSLANIPTLLKNFRQAVLTQAVTGKLTQEWRVGKELGEWEVKILGDLCHSITDGDHQAPPQVETGIPFLVISNVSKGKFDFDSVTRYVPESYYDKLRETRIPRKGDVLYTVTGSYGITLLVDFDKKFCFQRHIAILKTNNNLLDSSYLVFALNSPVLMSQAHNVATGTAQKTVSLKGIKSFDLSLPPLEEQQEIVRRVEALFAQADAIEARYATLQQKIEQLPQAILAKAFRGELVPQLPTDGDAKELLEEIKKLKVGGKKKK